MKLPVLRVMMLAVLLGCTGDQAAIVVSDSAPTTQFVFVNCKTPQRLLPVGRIEITRKATTTDTADTGMYQCKLEVDGNAGLVGAWRYGQAVPGYSMTGCSPLVPGETYEVFATLHNSPARASFMIEPTGRIRMLTGGCDE